MTGIKEVKIFLDEEERRLYAKIPGKKVISLHAWGEGNLLVGQEPTDKRGKEVEKYLASLPE